MVKDSVVKSIETILNQKEAQDFMLSGYFQINGATQSCEIEQISLGNSPLSFDFNTSTMLHFTNLDAFISIIKESKLRANSLESIKSDTSELLHILRLLEYDISEIEKCKKDIYISCFTPKYNSSIDSFEYHWKTYADNYQGVCMEFEVPKRCFKLPYPFFSLNVNYIDKTEESTFFSFIQGFKNEHRIEVLRCLVPFWASIKKKSFEKEKEIRFLAHLDYDSYEAKNISYDMGMRENGDTFIKLEFSKGLEYIERAFLHLKSVFFGKDILKNNQNKIRIDEVKKILNEFNVSVNYLT